MDLMRPGWALAAAAAAVAALVLALVFRRRKRRRIGSDRAVAALAGSETPAFRSAVRRYRALIGVEAASVAVLAVSSVMLVGRPGDRTEHSATRPTRDIVLCLDVSGSMTEPDDEVLDQFIDLLKHLDGDRIGLTIFDATPVTVFPLTDDYDYAEREMQRVKRGIRNFDADVYAGTWGNIEDGRMSMISDGYAACVQRFDRLDEERPRFLVLASDNDEGDGSIYTLEESNQLAIDAKITTFAVAPDWGFDEEYTDELIEELRTTVEQTGGRLFMVGDGDAAPEIAEAVRAVEPAEVETPPVIVENDKPRTWVLVALGASAVLMAAAAVARR